MRIIFGLSFNIVAPMFLMMLTGVILRNTKIIPAVGFKVLNSLCFWILFPSKLFQNIYSAQDMSFIKPRYIVWVLFLHGIMLILLFIIVPRMIKENPSKASVIQACFRANYISFGLVIAGQLMSNKDQAMVSVLAGIMIPIYNIGGILILSYYANKGKTISYICKTLISNPFVLACTLAIVIVFLKIQLTDSV